MWLDYLERFDKMVGKLEELKQNHKELKENRGQLYQIEKDYQKK